MGRESLQIAIEKLAIAGEQAGLSVDQMIYMLSNGITRPIDSFGGEAGPPATRTGTSAGNAVKTRRSSLSQESLVQFPLTAHPLEMCLDGYGPSRLLRTTGLSSTPQASSYRRGP